MYMEDRIMTPSNIMNQEMALFGVLDGHGGEFSANFYVQRYLLLFIKELAKNNASGDGEKQEPEALLTEVCRKAEEALREQLRMVKPPKEENSRVQKSGYPLISIPF